MTGKRHRYPPPGNRVAERVYDEEQLAIFARCRSERAKVPPKDCVGGAGCWVEEGPPGLTGTGSRPVCRRCGCAPRTLPPQRSELQIW